MPQGQDYSTIFQESENGSAQMAWQPARPHSYRKPVVYCEKSFEKT